LVDCTPTSEETSTGTFDGAVLESLHKRVDVDEMIAFAAKENVPNAALKTGHGESLIVGTLTLTLPDNHQPPLPIDCTKLFKMPSINLPKRFT
jgi:hypothetical protein